MSRLSLVIFGATGFTGQHAVVEMVRLSKKHPAITWGVAGRSQSKLETLMQDVAKKTGEDQSHIKIIIADVSDEHSLKAMCLQARVVVNCCGPYRLYGEPVVKAAIEAGAHHVDITGEPQFIESMQLRYSSLARSAGVYVVSACGYDSIPNDLGTIYLQQHFGGTLNSVESYMSSDLPSEYRVDAIRRGLVHYGTWESMVYGLSHYDELKPLRQKLYPQKLPDFKPKLENRPVLHKRKSWSVPFPGADNSVVYRTQRALYDADTTRPAHFRAYFACGSWIFAALLLLWAVAIYLLTKLSFIRRLLLQYPRVFSFGVVSHEGPSDSVMERTTYCVELYGQGWDQGTDVSGPQNKQVLAKVSGTNPGYGATVSALLYSAITILEEGDKMPDRGGVLTTGYAFKDTNLVKHLSDNNMKFEIVEAIRI